MSAAGSFEHGTLQPMARASKALRQRLVLAILVAVLAIGLAYLLVQLTSSTPIE